MTSIIAIILVIIATIIGSFGALLLKKGSGEFSLNIIKIINNKNVVFGVIIYVISAIFFLAGLRNGELSVLYPLVATSYIWTSLLSIYFLKEKMNKWKWIGVVLIIIGISFIGFGS